MKILILILICSNAVGQKILEKKLSKEICNCLSNQAELKNYSSDVFSKCFFKVARDNYSLIKTECIKDYGDTSVESGTKMGKRLENNLSVFMVDNCDIYYNLRNTKRNSDLFTITNFNQDSLQNIIDSLNRLPESAHDYHFFHKRGLIFFRLKYFEHSINDFDRAFKFDSTDYSTLAKEAWASELIGQYDKAIRLYGILTKKINTNLFLIYSAIARRKQNGL